MNKPHKQTRRQMLATSGGLLGASLLGRPVIAQDNEAIQKPLKILVAGGHPDDPESGCGGTITKFAGLGHEVAALYLTRGEAGVEGMSHEEAAETRTAEAIEACRVMKARPLFAGQIDGNTIINREQYANIARIIEQEKPDLVFTHWPIDTHPDHRVTSNLVYNAWNWFRGDDSKAFDLYYYEVLTGEQTQIFHPTHYIDITETAGVKKEATMKHACQKPDQWYFHHEKMAEFRGFEAKWGCKSAEAFVRQGFLEII
ncbi:MAG: PIG-L family deacetylase [Bacteroidales bacterium]|nr:PIG-L family deacetylase [Bacteroidales bacterium]